MKNENVPAPTETRPPQAAEKLKTRGIKCGDCGTPVSIKAFCPTCDPARAAALEEPPKFNEVAQYCRRCGHPCSDAQRLHCDACGYPLRDLVAEKLAYDKLPSAPVAAPEREPALNEHYDPTDTFRNISREPAPRPHKFQMEVYGKHCLICGELNTDPIHAAASSPAARPQEGDSVIHNGMVLKDGLWQKASPAARTEQPTLECSCTFLTRAKDYQCPCCVLSICPVHYPAAPVAVVPAQDWRPTTKHEPDSEDAIRLRDPLTKAAVVEPRRVAPYIVGVIPWRASGPGWANQGVNVIKDDRQGKTYTECLYLKDHPQLHDAWLMGIAAYDILLREVEKIEAADSQRKEGAADGKETESN